LICSTENIFSRFSLSSVNTDKISRVSHRRNCPKTSVLRYYEKPFNAFLAGMGRPVPVVLQQFTADLFPSMSTINRNCLV